MTSTRKKKRQKKNQFLVILKPSKSGNERVSLLLLFYYQNLELSFASKNQKTQQKLFETEIFNENVEQARNGLRLFSLKNPCGTMTSEDRSFSK